MCLCVGISPLLFEVSNDTASLVLCTKKNFCLEGAGFLLVMSYVEDFLATFTWPWTPIVRW